MLHCFPEHPSQLTMTAEIIPWKIPKNTWFLEIFNDMFLPGADERAVTDVFGVPRAMTRLCPSDRDLHVEVVTHIEIR